MVDLNSRVTQGQFGKLVGMSQQAVSELFRRHILRDGAPVGAWLKAYCEHLRDMAAGRGGEGGADLVAERARLAREQADRIAMQNVERREELASTQVLESVLVLAGAHASRILGTIPAELRTQLPVLSNDDISAVVAIVGKACSIAASMRLGDIEHASEDTDSAVECTDSDTPLIPASAQLQHFAAVHAGSSHSWPDTDLPTTPQRKGDWCDE